MMRKAELGKPTSGLDGRATDVKDDVAVVTGVSVFQEKKPGVSKGLRVKHESTSGASSIPDVYRPLLLPCLWG